MRSTDKKLRAADKALQTVVAKHTAMIRKRRYYVYVNYGSCVDGDHFTELEVCRTLDEALAIIEWHKKHSVAADDDSFEIVHGISIDHRPKEKTTREGIETPRKS